MPPLFTSCLVLLGEILVIGLSTILLYHARRRLGLAPLFFFLGGLEVGLYVYTGRGTVDFPFGAQVMPSSFVLFSGLLHAILLVYVLEGTAAARGLILCVLGLNVLYVVLDLTHSYQLLAPFGHPAPHASGLPLYAPFRMILASSLALVVDFFLLVVLYQFLVNHLPFVPEYFRFLGALGGTALVDVLVFNTGAFYGLPGYGDILAGQAVSKPLAAVVYAFLLWGYRRVLVREGARELPLLERAVFDVLGDGGRYAEATRRLAASEQAQRELAEANERLRALDRTKSQFLANMSHELRSPLNDVMGFTDLLLQELPGPLTVDQRKQLEIVAASGRHLLALINDLLDLSRVAAGRLDLHPGPVDLAAVARELAERYRPGAAQKGLALDVAAPPPGSALTTDEVRLKQILMNLLSNAVKFTEAGSVRVAFAAEAAGGVRIDVEDTGPGIRAEDLPLLFEEFRQLDSSHRRRHEGTGLGLALSRKLARLLGGDLTAASEFGRGSRFTLRLPAAVPGAAAGAGKEAGA